MDKHLLAENPMRSSEGGLCIIRTIQPVSMYEVIEGHSIDHKSKTGQYYQYQDRGGTMTLEEWNNDGRYDIGLDIGILKHYFYKNSDGETEHYTLRCHHYFSTDIDTVAESKVFKFMDDAWHWFMAYIKWQDEQVGY